MRRQQSKFFPPKGLTLIELIISVIISVLLLLMVVSMYNFSQNVYRQTDTKAEITQNGRVILDRLIRELRQTREVVTNLPLTNDNPALLPSEIKFQDGHDISDIRYRRYFLENSEIKKQTIEYYFAPNPTINVYWDDLDAEGNPPDFRILEEKIIGEYVSDLEFWGDKFINIKLYLQKNNDTLTLMTGAYGRNL